MVTATNQVVQYRPVGVAPVAVGDTLTWDFQYGANPTFAVAGFPTNTANSLIANDKSVGSASLQAFLVAGSLSAGTLQSGTSCTGASPALATDGGFCFSTPGDQNPCANTYTFQYYVNDGWAVQSAAATATINVINCDLPPIARDDPQGSTALRYGVVEGAVLNVGATTPTTSYTTACAATSGLLCNDWDSDSIPNPGPPGTLSVYNPGAGSSAAGNALTTQATGAFTYTPTFTGASHYCGLDSFTYEATDGIRQATATAYTSVSCVSDPPSAVADSYTLFEDCTSSQSNPGLPGATCSGAALTPDPSLACAAPRALAKGVLCNDIDLDTDDDAASGPNAGNTAGIGDANPSGTRDQAVLCTQPTRGTVNLASDGSFTYTPTSNYNGADSFTYRILDPLHGGGFNTACVTVSLTIAPVNEVPVANPDVYNNVPNVGPTSIVAASGVLVNDVNPDYLNPPPAYGGLTVSSWGAPVCGGQTGMSVTATGTDGHFTFNPPTTPGNYVGTCTFPYTVTNGPYSASTTVTINVVLPTAPFAIQDTCTLNEDPAPNPWPCAGNVFDNDYLFTGAPAPTAILDSPGTVAGVGTLVLQPTGTYTFAPALNWNGGVTFNYHFTQVDPSDGQTKTSPQAMISITVNSVNDRPAVPDIAFSCFDEDTAFNVLPGGLLAGASDTQGGAPNENNLWTIYTPNRLRVVVPPLPIVTPKGMVTALGDDGSFTYMPDLNQAGPDSFTFQVQDAGGTALGGQDTSVARTATLCITPTPDPPVAIDDPGAPMFAYTGPNAVSLVIPTSGPLLLVNDMDPDTIYTGDTFEVYDFSFVPVPGSGNTLAMPNTDGSFGFDPGAGFVGTQTFQYRLVDDTGLVSNWATVTMNIFQDSPPTAQFAMSSQSGYVGTTVSFTDLSTDADGDDITCWMWDFGDGVQSYQQHPSHRFNSPGTYTVMLTVCDIYGVMGSVTHVIVIEDPADREVIDGTSLPSGGGGAAALLAVAGEDQSVLEGSTVQLSGSSNPVGAATSYMWSQIGPGPRVTLDDPSAQTPTFEAPELASQEPVLLTFQLRVSDGAAQSLPDVMEVLVGSRNGVPVPVAGQSRTAWAGQRVILDGSASSDPDGDTLTYSWVQRDGPTVQLAGGRGAQMPFVVPEGIVGSRLVFQLQVSDGQATATDSVQVLIVPAPDEPAALQHTIVLGSATFTTTATGTTYAWDFGDGKTLETTVPTATHTYDAEGTYPVKLTVGGAEGEKEYQDSVDVVLEPKGRDITVEAASGSMLVPILVGIVALLLIGAAMGVFFVARRKRRDE